MSSERWETVTTESRDRDGGSNRLERIEVPGGWLYRTWVSHRTGLGVALSFVPAPCEVVAPLDLPEPPATVMGVVEQELREATAALGIPRRLLRPEEGGDDEPAGA